MAKQIAETKRKEEQERREKRDAELKRHDEEVNRIMDALKSALQQWNVGEGEFTYKNCGNYHHVDCAEIHRNGRKCLGFQCFWDHWTTQFSDDCVKDQEGTVIKITYYEEEIFCSDRLGRNSKELRKDTHHYYYDIPKFIDQCMESIANYLSKFL
jgi:hypothetical protein